MDPYACDFVTECANDSGEALEIFAYPIRFVQNSKSLNTINLL